MGSIRISALVLLLVVAGAACGDDDTSSAPTTSTSTTDAVPDLPGRLLFARFDESTHTFLSTHVASADGSDEVELTMPSPEGGGRWSHAGDRIAVVRFLDDDRVATAIIEVDGTVDRELTPPDATLNLACFVWSPDDASLACEGWDNADPSRRGIYLVDAADGGNLTRLTTTPEGMVDFPGDWSPDGSTIVFKRTVEEDDAPLLLVDVAGGEPRPLSADEYEDPGRFSPDGSSILTSHRGLVRLGLDGTELSRIDEPGASLFGPVWSPDGEWIAYSRGTAGPFADIWVSRPDGNDRHQITDTPDNEIVVEWGADPT